MGTGGRTVRAGGVHATLWGEPSDRLLVTVHGKHSHGGDCDIVAASRHALAGGDQVLTWDLPGHGARAGSPADCRITEAAAELDAIWSWTTQRFAKQRVFATSMGAYLTLITAPQSRLDSASFLSPVVDMAALVRGLMDATGVTEAQLRARGRVDTEIEPLEWDEYAFIAARPVLPWTVPTRILRGARDDLVPAASIEDFRERTGAEVTTVPGAAHHFHTAADLAALDGWLAEGLPTSRPRGLRERRGRGRGSR